MERVLLLNITYEPLKIINWKRAITLLFLEKVEVVEEYGREIHSISFSIKLPAVVRLLRMVKRPKAAVKFSRQNIYTRDKYRCQYCGEKFGSEELENPPGPNGSPPSGLPLGSTTSHNPGEIIFTGTWNSSNSPSEALKLFSPPIL